MIKAYAASKPGGRLEPFEYDPGPLGSHEVEIAVEHCGICHSDLSMLKDEWRASSFPLVPGHEVVGTLAAVGKGVRSLAVGQRVGLGWHSGYCLGCASCRAGDHNLCADAQGTIVGRHGGFADRVRASASAVVALPEALDAASAGPLFCGGITVFNPLVQFDVRPTDRVGVIGIGGLGHMAVQFLSAWGCEVTAFTSTGEKTQALMGLGAHHVVDSRDRAAIEGVAGTLDLILSTVNVPMEWGAYLSALMPRGRLHFVGVPMEPLDIRVTKLIGSQRSVSGSPVGSPATIERMLDFAVRHHVRPITEHFPFEQVNEAIAHLESGVARYRVVLSR